MPGVAPVSAARWRCRGGLSSEEVGDAEVRAQFALVAVRGAIGDQGGIEAQREALAS